MPVDLSDGDAPGLEKHAKCVYISAAGELRLTEMRYGPRPVRGCVLKELVVEPDLPRGHMACSLGLCPAQTKRQVTPHIA